LQTSRVPIVACLALSGLISDVFVHDNEKVSKGQQLFRIDQRRFQYALDQAKADVASQQATLDQAKRDLVRSKSLTDVAITRQQVKRAQQAADEAQAKLDAANATLEVARLNLERSTVLAPVNGIVTNFDLLPGRYVNVGAAVFALIDSDTFRVEGYFEETKLRRIRVGEDATVKLIGDSRVLSGHVESIAYGIEDQNRSTSSEQPEAKRRTKEFRRHRVPKFLGHFEHVLHSPGRCIGLSNPLWVYAIDASRIHRPALMMGRHASP
jgi:RND family efflux transporter MFP subunit